MIDSGVEEEEEDDPVKALSRGTVEEPRTLTEEPGADAVTLVKEDGLDRDKKEDPTKSLVWYNQAWYSPRGYRVCGVRNQRGSVCSRIGACPFHRGASGVEEEDGDAPAVVDPEMLLARAGHANVVRSECEPVKDHWKRAWTKDEHERFLRGMSLCGRGKWKEVAEVVGTRTASQVQSHAQKFFLRQEKKERKKRSIHDQDTIHDVHGKVQRIVRSQKARQESGAKEGQAGKNGTRGDPRESGGESDGPSEGPEAAHHHFFNNLLPVMVPISGGNTAMSNLMPMQMLSAMTAQGTAPLISFGGNAISRVPIRPIDAASFGMPQFGTGLAGAPTSTPSAPQKLRITAHRNGDLANGKAMIVPGTLEEMLKAAAKKLEIPHCTHVYTRSGGQIESLDEILNDDSLYFSMGEPFIDPDEDED